MVAKLHPRPWRYRAITLCSLRRTALERHRSVALDYELVDRTIDGVHLEDRAYGATSEIRARWDGLRDSAALFRASLSDASPVVRLVLGWVSEQFVGEFFDAAWDEGDDEATLDPQGCVASHCGRYFLGAPGES
jgi:hypothetical protein